MAAVHWDVQQELGDVAGAEHLVHGGKPGGALVGAEVRSKYAPADALPPQELASPARGSLRRKRRDRDRIDLILRRRESRALPHALPASLRFGGGGAAMGISHLMRGRGLKESEGGRRNMYGEYKERKRKGWACQSRERGRGFWLVRE